MAGEAGIASAGEDTTKEKLLQMRSQARIEFEIRRDPGRQDNQIAKACGTSGGGSMFDVLPKCGACTTGASLTWVLIGG